MPCTYCNEYPCDGYLSSYCEDCAMLRRMLKIHDAKKCVNILKRVLIRNENQVNNKINIELKTLNKVSNDSLDYDPPKTRSNKINIEKK